MAFNLMNIIRGRWDPFIRAPTRRKLAAFLAGYLGLALVSGWALPFTDLGLEVAGISLKIIWGAILIIIGSWIWYQAM